MNKKIALGAAIAFMAIVVAATMALTRMWALRSFNGKVNDLVNREERYSKLAMIDDMVRENYNGSIPQEGLMDAISQGFMEGIGDPYAQYYSSTQYQRLQNEYSGKSVQIGIVEEKDDSGYILVTEVYPDSPAMAAGIEAGDLIVKIDDMDVSADNYYEAIANLRGEAGSTVSLTIRRNNEDRELPNITRRFVETPSVSSELLVDQIGLIRFSQFNNTTPDQFIKQVDALMDEGAIGLILDVRGVDTCTIDPVADVLDKLLPAGELVYTSDKSNSLTVLKSSDAREVDLPMAVLINEKTTCEAELFAAVIRDYGKGRLVGVKTFGKGTVQRILPLPDGSGAIRLTTALYLPPSQKSFDKEGIKPDFEVKMNEELMALPETDLQLLKAREVVAGMRKSSENGA
ncbi:MAG: PDZ domain-containing protein [Oscillospiraceae bacterium]|nr:PDZ domain-containing protein [Oscillospiraceae bacterium]MCI9668395.1 PDZ domain-containing protein [Oscillospiraceae bacterium]